MTKALLIASDSNKARPSPVKIKKQAGTTRPMRTAIHRALLVFFSVKLPNDPTESYVEYIRIEN